MWQQVNRLLGDILLRNMTWVTESLTNHSTDHSIKESDEDTPEDDVQDTGDDAFAQDDQDKI